MDLLVLERCKSSPLNNYIFWNEIIYLCTAVTLEYLNPHDLIRPDSRQASPSLSHLRSIRDITSRFLCIPVGNSDQHPDHWVCHQKQSCLQCGKAHNRAYIRSAISAIRRPKAPHPMHPCPVPVSESTMPNSQAMTDQNRRDPRLPHSRNPASAKNRAGRGGHSDSKRGTEVAC
jgi:hypothetical protein